jgi:hypothetical protein
MDLKAMTRKQAVALGVTVTVWLVIAFAIGGWSRGIFLWPVVFLGGLAVARHVRLAVMQDNPRQSGTGRPVSDQWYGPTSRPGPRHRNW